MNKENKSKTKALGSKQTAAQETTNITLLLKVSVAFGLIPY